MTQDEQICFQPICSQFKVRKSTQHIMHAFSGPKKFLATKWRLQMFIIKFIILTLLVLSYQWKNRISL